MNAPRNYLTGLLAMRHKKASAEVIAEIAHRHPQANLCDSLLEAGLLTAEEHGSILSQVDEAIATHGNDTGAAATSLGVPPEEAHTLAASLSLINSAAKTLITETDHANTATVVTNGPADDQATVMTDDFQSTAATLAGGAPPAISDAHGLVPAVAEHKGRYDTLRTFAAGGMGKILLVHDTHLGRDIALKMLLPERLPGGTFFTRTGAPTVELLTVPIIARFLQEAHITGQLEHPTINPVYELGYREDGSLYYTMKFVRGKTMQDAIKDATDIHERLKLLMHFLNLCEAIAYAHSRGVIHRDLKPLNIMIGEFGETVLIDWGIAKLKGQQDIHARDIVDTVRAMRVSDAEATAKTMYGQTIGSPYYMPPEQAAGELDKVVECADIYSLGAVLYHILTGEPPYKGNNVREFLEKVKTFDPKPIREIEPLAPPELIAVVNRAMQRNPEDRYGSAKELAGEIEQFLSGGLVSAYDYDMGELVRRFVRKHWKVLSTAAAGLIALIAFGVYYNIRVTEQRNIAVAAQEAEEVARVAAENAKDAEAIQRKQAQRELYFASVALAQRSMAEQLMEKARAQLVTAPADYRGWEWGHLQHEANADLITLQTGGRYVKFQGETLIAGKANGTVESWNLADGNKGTTFVEKAGFGYAMDHDESKGLLAVSGDDAVTVYDVTSGTLLFRHEETNKQSTYHVVSLDRVGARVAALNSDRKIRVWSLATGEEELAITLEQDKGAHLELSPDGNHLLVGQATFGVNGFDHTFAVHRVGDGAIIGETTLTAPDSVHTSAFSPDGALLAVGLDNSLKVWNVEPWSERFSLPGRYAFPGTIAFSADGAHLAAGTRDGGLGVWRTADGKGVTRDNAHLDQIRGIAFSPDGSLVASVAADRTARLWQAAGLTPLKVFRGHDSSLFNLAFSGDGKRLATTSFDGEAKVWDLEATADWTTAKTVAWQTAGGRLAGARDEGVDIWVAATGHLERHLDGLNGAYLLAFDDNAPRLAGASDKTITVWDTASGEPLQSWTSPNGTRAMHFANDAKTLLVEHPGQLSAYGVEDGASMWTTDADAWTANPVGDQVAIARKQDAGGYRVFVGESAAPPAGEGRAVSSDFGIYLAWSANGEWILAGGVQRIADGNEVFLEVVDAVTGEARARLIGHGQDITATALSPDGDLLATGSKDSTVMLWSTADWKLAGTLKGHAGNINDVTFSPDGARIVTASQDGTFKIWDVGNRREIMTIQDAALSAEGQVVSPVEVAFSARGDSLLTRTKPAVQPVILRAFPWDASEYPGGEDTLLEDRVEDYKRAHGVIAPAP